MPQSQETTIALMLARIDELENREKIQDDLIAAIRSERDKALLWGIAALGTMVVSMGAWIFSFIKVPFK